MRRRFCDGCRLSENLTFRLVSQTFLIFYPRCDNVSVCWWGAQRKTSCVGAAGGAFCPQQRLQVVHFLPEVFLLSLYRRQLNVPDVVL